MRIVIAGGGQGGVQAAASLRAEGWDGEVVVVSQEPGLPYQRPPLSKDFLAGKSEARQTELRAAAFYDKQRIDLRVNQRVAAIDRASKTVRISPSGADLAYDHLILATGARNRTLPVEGASLPHVCYLRTLAESAHLRDALRQARRIAVIGGGFIGLEVAAIARAQGRPVTVIEALPRLMARVVAPIVSDFFRDTHLAQGVEVLFGTAATRITADAVYLQDGRAVEADLVVVGIGVVPNVELARAAGLAIGNGIAVDELLRTEDPAIFAIGDCAEFPSPYSGTRVRLESVQNCVDQGIAVAKTIAGKPAPYSSVPWFWTEQFDIRMQMAGIAPQWDQLVTRGNPAERKFSVFSFDRGTLKSVDSINRPADHLAARKLIAGRVGITPEQAADETFDLKRASQ